MLKLILKIADNNLFGFAILNHKFLLLLIISNVIIGQRNFTVPNGGISIVFDLNSENVLQNIYQKNYLRHDTVKLDHIFVNVTHLPCFSYFVESILSTSTICILALLLCNCLFKLVFTCKLAVYLEYVATIKLNTYTIVLLS